MISVIIPIYNQYESLNVVLSRFCNQIISEPFEIVVVDDGSENYDTSIIKKYKSLEIKYIRNEKNKGRAYARNIAIDKAKGEFLVFCDGDRFPTPDFIYSHVNLINTDEPIISVGYSSETYQDIDQIINSDKTIMKRKSIYYKAISQIYDEFGQTDSHLCWLSTLSGNMALKKSTLADCKFDCDFKDWGFEHFELGYRLWKKGSIFINNLKAENIHIAHARKDGFYEESINKSYSVFLDKHPVKEVYPLKKFVMGELSLQEYEASINGSLEWAKDKKRPIFINGINL